MDQFDVYVATRLAFIDRPDVRICQRDHLLAGGATTYAFVGVGRLIGYRFGRPIWDGEKVRFVAFTIDDLGLATGLVDRACIDACAADLRRQFDARIGATS